MKSKSSIHPASVYFILWWLTAVVSWIGSIYSWTGVRSLFSAEALRWILRYNEDFVMSSPVIYDIIILFIGGVLFVNSGLKSVLIHLLKHDRNLSGKERKSLLLSAIVALAYFVLLAVLLWGPWNIVRGITGRFNDSPINDGALFVFSLGIGMVAIVYGLTSDYYRRDTDIVRGMSCLFAKYSSYLVSVFFAIQFLSAFHYTGINRLLGISGIGFDIMYYACCILPIFSKRV